MKDRASFSSENSVSQHQKLACQAFMKPVHHGRKCSVERVPITHVQQEWYNTAYAPFESRYFPFLQMITCKFRVNSNVSVQRYLANEIQFVSPRYLQ